MRDGPNVMFSEMHILLYIGGMINIQYSRIFKEKEEKDKKEGAVLTCDIGRRGGICCRFGNTGGFLTCTKKYITRRT